MSTSSEFDALPRTRRGWIILVVFGVLFAAAFALVTVFYNAEGGVKSTGGMGNDTRDGIIMFLSPDSVDAVQAQASFHALFRSDGETYVDGEGRATKDLRISIETGNGTTEVRYPAGVSIGQTELLVALDGEVASYPFDTFDGTISVVADTYERASDGSLTSTGVVPVGLDAQGGVNGWDTQMDMSPGMGSFGMAEITFSRAFSTQVFSLLIIVLALLLGFFTLLVGVLVFNGRRPAEVALLGWTAAVIFALPLLRNYMPNAPPFGAAIDIYVYLWIIVMAVAGAVLVILGWITQKKPVTHSHPPTANPTTADPTTANPPKAVN